MYLRSMFAAAMIAACVAPAQAALFTDATGFGAVDEDFESFDGLVVPSPWPTLIAGGSVAVSADGDSTLGAFAVDLGENGTWGAGNRFAGIGDLVNGGNDYDGAMYFSFDAAYGAGAQFSIYQMPAGTATITLEAYGAGFDLLESHSFVIDFADPLAINASLFFGIGRDSAEVVGLRVSGDGFVLDDLRVATAPVPVPAALPLFLGGVGLLGAAARRRRA